MGIQRSIFNVRLEDCLRNNNDINKKKLSVNEKWKALRKNYVIANIFEM